MKFANLSDSSLSFDVRGVAFHVAPGEECEIPDRFAYVVERRGLMLTPSADVEPTPTPAAVEPTVETVATELVAERPKRRRF